MKKILLGVCGGISAYKSCELVRELRRQGSEVSVIMTEAAQKFVTKLTFESLTGNTVYTDLFGEGAFGTAHIDLARWAEGFVVAPASADTLAKLAHGQANDFLSTTYLAYSGPVLLAPAMNSFMWNHPAVKNNLEQLVKRNVQIISPEEGELACGEVGIGKMADPLTICKTILNHVNHRNTLTGQNIVVTAGATREYLDPVRFISSPSTGKMGFAIAREASTRGANVTLVYGPSMESKDFNAEFIPITSASEMFEKVLQVTPTDIFISAAAVSDFKPSAPSREKLKKDGKTLRIDLEPMVDILGSVASKKRQKDLVIGFAAETQDLVENARKKLVSKKLDLIVANHVDKEKKGFSQDLTSVTFIDQNSISSLDRISKQEVARALWDQIETILNKQEKNRAHS